MNIYVWSFLLVSRFVCVVDPAFESSLERTLGAFAELGSLSVMKRSPVVTIVISAVMAALVTVATYLIQIPVPATGGYINVGDAMVFTSALLFGPVVGGIAGGLGSAISDLLSPFAYFAPITLVVKGLEGLLAGLVSNGRSTPRDFLAVLIGGTVMVSGYLLTEVYVLGVGIGALAEVPGNLFQIIFGGLVGIPVSLAIRKYTKGLR
ncbi:ECF transporter S component [Candidatus Bathyarchaeota archaeon]|nr:ECF transporter S component [Candidatus Bathyarchaeota archaeon]